MFYTIAVKVNVATPPQASLLMVDLVRDIKSCPNPQIKLIEAQLVNEYGTVEASLDAEGNLISLE